MVTRKSRREIEKMRRAGRIVAEVLALVESELKPGVSTGHLDRLAERHIRGRRRDPVVQGLSAAAGSNPASRPALCISIDDEVVHGIPGDRTIRDGPDRLGRRRRDLRRLARRRRPDVRRRRRPSPRSASSSTRRALAMMAGIAAAVPGARIGDISAAIEDVAAAARLRHRPPVRRPRHRHRDAPGAAGPELPDRRPRA